MPGGKRAKMKGRKEKRGEEMSLGEEYKGERGADWRGEFHAGEQPIRHTAGGQTKPSPG